MSEQNKRKVLKCFYCKEMFNREELVQVNKSVRSCPKCLESKRKEVEDRKELIDYICKGFNQSSPTGYQLRDIKRFREELGYKYKEIQWTIYYIAAIKGKTMKDGNISLVPFYYEEAKKHFETVARNRAATYEEAPKEEVVIKRNRDLIKSPKYNKTRYVDITKIY